MKTIYTKAQQAEWLKNNRNAIEHKWSLRGYGNSRIIYAGEQIAHASGCGYDRRGKAMGEALIHLFPEAVNKLAKRHCKGKRRTYKQPKNRRLYGLFYNSVTGKAWIDGACGFQQVQHIANAIGFSIQFVGDTGSQKNTGSEFFTLEPVTRRELDWLRGQA